MGGLAVKRGRTISTGELTGTSLMRATPTGAYAHQQMENSDGNQPRDFMVRFS